MLAPFILWVRLADMFIQRDILFTPQNARSVDALKILIAIGQESVVYGDVLFDPQTVLHQ